MVVTLMVVPHHDPDGDHGDQTDDEGGGGDERRPRKPRGGGPLIQAGVFTSHAAAATASVVLGNLRGGIELFVEQSVAGIATRCGGDGGGVHSSICWIRIARRPISDAAVEVGAEPVAMLAVLGRIGLPLLFDHCAYLVNDSSRFSEC